MADVADIDQFTQITGANQTVAQHFLGTVTGLEVGPQLPCRREQVIPAARKTSWLIGT